MANETDGVRSGISENERTHEGAENEVVEVEDKAFFVLGKNCVPRRWLIRLFQWTWFERISMFVILINCVTLAMYDPLDKRCVKTRCHVLERIEHFIFVFFLLEMVVKMVAMGVLGKRGYLQDTWNRLDFVIIIVGIVEKALQGSDYLTIIRAFRVLRPLRAINKVPSIRILVTLLLDTLPMLGNVLLLSFLIFFVFGIIGVQLWQGKLRNRCFTSDNHTQLYGLNKSKFYQHSFDKPDFICSLPRDSGMTHCRTDIPHTYRYNTKCSRVPVAPGDTKRNGTGCDDWNSIFTECREKGPNPFWGTTSFDNIAIAWMVIFQVITLEGWSEIMYLVQDSHSFWNWIYFIILIVIGAFFLVNLCLVVITMQFQETKAREIELMEENRKRQHYNKSNRINLSCLETLRRTFCPGHCKKSQKEHVHHHHHHIYHHHHFHHHLYDCYAPASPALPLPQDENQTFFGQDAMAIPEIKIDEDIERNSNVFLRPPDQFALARRDSDSSVCSHAFSIHAEAASSVSLDEMLTTSSVTLTVPGAPTGLFAAAAHASSSAATPLPDSGISNEHRASFKAHASALATAEVHADRNCLRTQREKSRSFTSKDERIECARESPYLSRTQQTSHNNSPDVSRSESPTLSCTRETSRNESPNLPRSQQLSRRYSQPFGLKEVTWSCKASLSRQKNRRLDLKGLDIEELELDTDKSDKKLSFRKLSVKNRKASVQGKKENITRTDSSQSGQDLITQDLKRDLMQNVSGKSTQDLTQDLKRDLMQNVTQKSTQDLTKTSKRYLTRNETQESTLSLTQDLKRDLISPDVHAADEEYKQLSLNHVKHPETTEDLQGKTNLEREEIFDDTTIELDTSEVTKPRPTPLPPDDDMDGSVLDFHQCDSYDVSQDLGRVHQFRSQCRRIAEGRHFTRFIMAAILLNMICMGLEHHNQPEELTDALEISNIIFVTIFVVEMLFNLISYGIKGYISQLQNVFDGFVVIVSVTELLLENGYARLSIFRSIRLLRIFKLVRPVRYQLLVVIRTMTSVVTFFGLLFLFMFAFAILGMNLFGGDFYFPNAENVLVPARTNFDSFLWAMVTVFQILTQENWNQVMFKGMRATSYWAALYFIALMTVGYYVLFNLLVAILVEGFTSSGHKRQLTYEETYPTSHGPVTQPQDKTEATSQKSVANNSQTPVILINDETTCQGEHFEPTIHYCGHGVRNAVFSNATPLDGDYANKPLKNFRDGTPPASFNTKVLGPSGSELSLTMPELKQMRQTSISILRKTRRNPEFLTCPTQPVYNPAFVEDELPTSTVTNEYQNTQREMQLMPMKSCTLENADETGVEMRRFRSGDADTIEETSLTDLDPESRLVYREDSVPMAHYSEFIDEENCTTKPRRNRRRQSTLVQKQKTGFFAVKHDWSLYLFSPQNRFRNLMSVVCNHRIFDYVILVFILLSCGVLAMEAPDIAENGIKRKIIDTSMFVFTIIFTIEMLMKLVAMGLVIGPGTYLKDGWNVLDGFLVMVSWIDVIITHTTMVSPEVLGTLRVFRALRTLRPLRMIRRAPGLKLVVQTLLYSLKPIGNTVLIAAIFFVMFGILGVQLFKGQFYYCEGDSHVENKQQCLNSTYGRWENRRYNFDNLLQALISLFVVSTRDGWVEIMHHGIDAVKVDAQPIVNYAEWRLVYFIPFLLLGGFLVLNMIVGVVVENFQRCRERLDEEEQARPHSINKNDDKKRARDEDARYYETYSPLRRRIHNICIHKYWDISIAAIICINVICMSLEHYNMPQSYDMFVEITNYYFTAVFVIEVIVKVIALGWVRYPKDRWNLVDLFIVVLSVAGIVMDLLVKVDLPLNPIVIRTLRVLRIARVLKLVKLAKGVRSLLDTLFEALPQVANLGLLFLLLFFIYSCLGIQLFGSLECSHDYPCQGLSRHAHFRNFGTAMLTLFRIATGDNWNGILKDTLRSKCHDAADCNKNCCLSKYTSPLFFVTFVLAAQFVLVNVVIAVLMKHLKESKEKIAATMAAKDIEKKLRLLTLVAKNFIRAKAARKSSASQAVRRRSVVELGLGGIELAQLKTHTNKWMEKTFYRDVAKADAIFQEFMHLNASLHQAKIKAMRTTSNNVERTSNSIDKSPTNLRRRHSISDLRTISPQSTPAVARRTIWKSGCQL